VKSKNTKIKYRRYKREVIHSLYLGGEEKRGAQKEMNTGGGSRKKGRTGSINFRLGGKPRAGVLPGGIEGKEDTSAPAQGGGRVLYLGGKERTGTYLFKKTKKKHCFHRRSKL